jgi:FkbM family methyltransferase
MDDALRRPPLWVSAATTVLRQLPAGRYRAASWLSRRPGRPFVARLPVSLGGLRFRCDLQDAIAREVCFTGRYEPQETALLLALLPPGGTFLDVGANWGYFTLVGAVRIGPSGRVVGLEPDPRLFSVLVANLRLNRLDHALALPLAAAASPGLAVLRGYDEAGGNRGLSRIVDSGPAGDFTVSTTDLDSLADRIGLERADVVKIDVEGAERQVLEGMRRGLRARVYRHILLELHPTLAGPGELASAVNLLRNAGYTGWAIDHSPAGARRAAYRRHLVPADLLRPMGDGRLPDDPWPHMLWTCAGETAAGAGA